ncbi:hypothetical protein SAMN05518849_114103 [Sphingobium sp. AP50]|nr:hypothetical protein SAMN05518849_114103 [Sphingobium sp. AP50]
MPMVSPNAAASNVLPWLSDILRVQAAKDLIKPVNALERLAEFCVRMSETLVKVSLGANVGHLSRL